MSKPIKWLDRSLVLGPYFTLCTNPKQFKRALNHLKIPTEQHPSFLSTSHANATAHFFAASVGRAVIVCIGAKKQHSVEQVAALLAHEAVHIWQDEREAIGERAPSSEFEAYAIQSLFQRLFEEYRRQVK